MPPRPATEAADEARHRIGAVASMLRMPVATLRVWERRYGLTQRAPSPGGQRRYTPEDVRRLALIKRLTDLGHAIGSVASLDVSQLQRVVLTHAAASALAQDPEPPDPAPRPAWRLAVIGDALGQRLQRTGMLRRLGRPVMMLGPFRDAAQAADLLRGSTADALLIHEPQLHVGWTAAFATVAPTLAGLPKAVLYGFAADPVCEAIASGGVALLREPQPDAVMAQWLQGLSRADLPQPPAATRAEAVAPRRWDDAALVAFAGMASTVACECPRHVAELLLQLSHFEAYSAECEHRSTADAELHAYLRNVAAASRCRFEAALEHVALHEGLTLP